MIGLQVLVLAAALGGTAVAEDAPPPACEEVCVQGCPGGQPCFTLALRFTVNVGGIGQRPVYETVDTFTGENYPTREAAFCGARKIRREGYVVVIGNPLLERNVMPESITPMPVI